MVLSGSLKKGLETVAESPVLWNAPLSAWTTFRIGGPAEALVTVNRTEELQSVILLCNENEIDWKVLGRGSNMLVSDEGFSGIIIILGDGFKSVSRGQSLDNGNVVVEAGAAISLSRIGDWAAEQGLSGLEFAAGIPGTMGGALAMNAGAWGSEIGDLVDQVTLVGDNDIKRVPGRDLTFSYRCWDDINKALADYVVTGVDLQLAVAETITVQGKMREIRRQRWERQPVGMANGGSFFKNPAGKSAGQLIEASNLKGVRVGDAEVSEKHANFFVNRGNATAGDMMELMRKVQDRVKRDSGITLEPEVHLL
jgi:UDP-N-acetylmuramate dehydrogenase